MAKVTVSAYQAIADPTRRRILDALRDHGPQKAGDLARRFPRISRPAVSRHMRVLRGSGLVLHERRGRELWYRLDPAPLTQIDDWMKRYRGFWQNRLEKLKRSVEG